MSQFGTKRTSQSAHAMSAFGGKADIGRAFIPGEHTAAVTSSIGGISALFERQPDTLDHKVMDPASFIESNLPQRLIRGFRQINARVDDVGPRPTPYGLRWGASSAHWCSAALGHQTGSRCLPSLSRAILKAPKCCSTVML
jgi:hypothetical protein